MKPFLPQLQTTFTKALNDSNRTVRLKAAAAMGGLILIHTRVDPLITELHTNIKNTDDTSIRWVMKKGCWVCLFFSCYSLLLDDLAHFWKVLFKKRKSNVESISDKIDSSKKLFEISI